MTLSLEQQIRNFLIEGTTLEAIQFFNQIPDLSSSKKKELLQLEVRTKKNDSLFIRGLSTLEQSRVEETKIVKTLIELIDQEPLDLSSIAFSEEGITERILLISRTQKENEEEYELLKKFKFRNVVPVVAASYDQLEVKLNQYEKAVLLTDETQKPVITIWDNRDLKACPEEDNLKDIGSKHVNKIHERIHFLQDCIDNQLSEYYMHYGEPFFFVTQHRGLIYSSNSRFSLIGRLKEMLEYIKAYGG